MSLTQAAGRIAGIPEPWLPDPGSPEVIHGIDRLRTLAGELTKLASRCGAPVTGRPAWVFPDLDLDDSAAPWGVFVRDRRGALESAALLVTAPRSQNPGTVTLAGTMSGHRGELLAIDQRASRRLGVSVATAIAELPGLRVRLGPLDATSDAAGALALALPGARLEAAAAIPVLRIDRGTTLADYLAGTTLRTLRKATNRLATDGHELEVTWTKEQAMLASLLPRLEDIHRARDHDRGRTSDLDDHLSRLRWHARMDGLSKEGSLELAAARIDGELAAYVLAITDRPTYRVLEGHLVGEWSRYAPGRMLEAAVLRRVIAGRSYRTLDWMTSVAPESLLAVNGHDPVVTVIKD